MAKLLTKPKFHALKLLGTVLLCYGASCYMFGYPNPRHPYENAVEALIGAVLISVDLKPYLKELVEAVLDRFFNRKK